MERIDETHHGCVQAVNIVEELTAKRDYKIRTIFNKKNNFILGSVYLCISVE